MTVSDDGQSAAGWFRETVRDGQPSSSGGDVAWRRLTASIPDNRRIGNMAGGGQSGGGSLTIQAAVRRVKQGEVVRIPVSILNASQVTNANFTILYHPDIARPEGNPVRGAFVSNALFSANTGEAGVIRAGFSQTSGTSGSGVIAELVFRAVGPPRSRTELTVQVSKLNDQGGANLNAARIDGAIEIEAAAPVQTGGDCDGDGRLTEADALCALRMSVRLMPENMGLDMDSDRQVTSRDSTIILQKAIGK
jgi:hypothetical protein